MKKNKNSTVLCGVSLTPLLKALYQDEFELLQATVKTF